MADLYNVLITYDIDSKHTNVRNSLINDYGFKEYVVSSNNNKCYLPNTTLYKSMTTKESCFQTLQNVCKDKEAILVRAISIKVTDWWAYSEEPF